MPQIVNWQQDWCESLAAGPTQSWCPVDYLLHACGQVYKPANCQTITLVSVLTFCKQAYISAQQHGI